LSSLDKGGKLHALDITKDVICHFSAWTVILNDLVLGLNKLPELPPLKE
jgi:hypothetical protein